MSAPRGKALLYVGLGLAALVLVLILALTFMDWNRFKGPLERSASAHFGREVRIEGPLEVRVWSRTPMVTISGLTIGNPPWESHRPMARIERVEIELELFSLLRLRPVLRRLVLVHPELYLHQEKSGRANWTSENQAPTRTPAAQPTSLPAMRDVVIDSGKLTVIDELRRLKVEGTLQAHQRASRQDPKPFHVKAEGTINNKPFKLDIAGGPLRALSPEQPYPFSLEITAGENEIRSDGKVLKPFDLGGLELEVDAHGRDLAELYYLTQITLPNSPPYKVHARIVRHGTRFAVNDIAGTWGASDVSGSIDIDAATKRPSVKADLLSRHLYLKDFAAVTGSQAQATPASLDTTRPGTRAAKPPAVAAAPAPPQPGAQLFPDAHLQVERLRAIDADLHFRASSIEAGSVPFTQLDLHVKLLDGALSLEPIEFELPQGRLSANIHIETTTLPPKVRVESRATGIRLAQLKGKGPGAVPPFDGTLEARAVLAGTGDSVHDFMSGANGMLTVVVPNGDVRSAFAELTGIDVAAGIGLLVGKADERMPLRCGVMQFNLEHGTAHAKDIVFDTEKVLITGEGQIYLGPENLDLTIQGQPKKVRLVRLRAPVEIRGKLLKPSFRLETGHVLKQGGIAVALGALLTPIAAVLAFVDPGLAKDQNCALLIAQAKRQANAPAPAR
jgi:AsmA family protein